MNKTKAKAKVVFVGGPWDGVRQERETLPLYIEGVVYKEGKREHIAYSRHQGEINLLDGTYSYRFLPEGITEKEPEWKPTNNPKDALGTAKAPLHLVPQSLMVAASMAFLEGREKYGQYNWRATGVRASVYQAALMRHMFAWFDGEDLDPDSGLPHLWKAAACLGVLIDAEHVGCLEDDRPPRAPTAELMAETKEMGEAIRERLKGFDPFQYTEKNRREGPQEDPGPAVLPNDAP